MTPVLGLVLVALLVAIAVVATLGTGPAIGFAAVLVIIDIALLRTAATRRVPGRERLPSVLAACWLTTLLYEMHNIQHRSTEEVVQSLSTQTAIEIVLFAIVGAVAFFVIRTVVPIVPITPPLAALPVVLTASAAWGRTPMYSMARGMEVFVLVVLAMATAGLAAHDRKLFEKTVWMFLRWTAWAVAALALAGVALGPLYVNRSPANADRFTWIGAHPGSAGFLLSVGFLIVIAAPRQALGIARWPRIVMIVGFAIALYSNQARTAVLTVGLGVLLVGRHVARRRPDSAFLITVGMTIIGVLSAGFIGQYFLRGGDTDTILTMNGRTELWQIAYDELDTFGKWMLGLGFGSGRIIFVEDFRFATSAHNSLLSAVVDVGLVGSALFVTGTLFVIWRALRDANAARHLYSVPIGALMLAIFATAATSDRLLRPGTAMVLLYFAAAVIAADQVAETGPQDSTASTVSSVAGGDTSARSTRAANADRTA